MAAVDPFADYHDYIGSSPSRFYKTTLFQTERLLLGLDCLEPGQSQDEHRHAGRDKFYAVLEGRGSFRIGGAERELGPGQIAWAAADVTHSVINPGPDRLVLLIGIAPEPN